MIKLREAVIVEGKYDKIRLSNILDATIIPTDGFRIFKDNEKMKTLNTSSPGDQKCHVLVKFR